MTWILHGWITAKDYFHSSVRINVMINTLLSLIFVGLNFHYFKQYNLRYLEKKRFGKINDSKMF